MLASLLFALPAVPSLAAKPISKRGWFTPNLDTTFLLDLDREPVPAPTVTSNTGITLNEEVYTVDLYGSTPDQIATYHSDGKKVTCYFTAGTWDQWNADALDIDPACYCGPGVARDSQGLCTGPGADTNKQPSWNEWFLDLHTPACYQNITAVYRGRIANAAAKGCDAIDPDNVDTYQQSGQKFGVTAEDNYNLLMFMAETAHADGLAIDLKNDNGLLVNSTTGEATQYQASLVQNFDWEVIEACHVYNECYKYQSFLDAGKPQVLLEYNNLFTSCDSVTPALQHGQKLIVFSGGDIDSRNITLVCGE